jgi:3-oxoacyl-[acyl-carrier protein] reductase
MTDTTQTLAGKTALVTGASGGIGAAIALTLASRGARVAVHYFRNAASAEAVVAAIVQAGGQAFTVGGDAADPEGAASIVDTVVATCGTIDILVNNAGTLQAMPFGQITKAGFDEQFGANVLAVILMMQAAVPHFPARGGRIVNLSTNIVTTPLPGLAVYCAAKAAVSTLTHAFAKELGPRRITVNAVAPGGTRTPMTDWLTDDMRQGIAAATPLGRMAEPDDIAGIVAFLASDDARWVNGRVIVADGGLV